MGAITVRNLPNDVHTKLRHMAADAKVSVEALVRNVLAEAVAQMVLLETGQFGMSEASPQWVHAPAGSGTNATDLFGALRGTILVPPETNLAEPTGESWGADS